ncbi:Flp pilus assembly protein CpaB [Moraxella nonliquefaciens]|uniref:Flp pilus assembly protein CpaB n=1 Tax=Moraxella nonliquefaciens TaxID=478 RepID=A0A1B8QL69_MORNO|nr:Flp pilus assembly protein CpaB [Moraxella nonliquefaciens]OBX84502.1 Flp pilus assembly protein CpaB [Moraxella nonliquefaciens]QPT45468.1 Flp pilus assembly protein CpaB [Moraxella nonliquefaciens]QQC30501.1 Flp pilus assembly protein CpaB [Moraxella nonliquefaciens]
MKKINKNILALVVAVVLALICALLLKVVIDRKISSSLQVETVSYVVANGDLTSGSIIDPFDSQQFAVRSDIPADLAQSNAITPNDANAISGALLIANMKRGDILTWQMVDTDERRQLASKLLPGRRALTIPVDDQSSISSMLKPNDRIDLLLSYDKGGMVVAAPLLQNVRVIATGDNVSTNYMVSGQSLDRYANITLDLSIDDVSRVTTALDLGRISAVLRNPDDVSYTDKIISLETLQEELSLRMAGTNINQNHNVIADNYEEEIKQLQEVPKLSDEPVKTEKNTGITVIYGNKIDK